MLKKLFTNDKFFLAMVILAVIGEIVFSLTATIYGKISILTKIPLLLSVICVVALYIAYQKHSKNVMKGMMGALLMGQITFAFSSISSISAQCEIVFCTIYILLTILLFLNHFIINADRSSSQSMVTLNQILVVLLALNNIVWNASRLAPIDDIVIFTSKILDMIGFICMISVVICVESRLDAYRLDREAAGWTEETGYPEGYVHQKDR